MSKQRSAAEPGVVPTLDANGHEIPDDAPVAIPVRFQRPQNLLDQMRGVVEEMNRRALEHEMETWEEANDFDVGDDYEPSSQWEVDEQHDENYYADRRDHYRAQRSNRSKNQTGANNSGETPSLQPDQSGNAASAAGTGPGKGSADQPNAGAPAGVTK